MWFPTCVHKFLLLNHLYANFSKFYCERARTNINLLCMGFYHNVQKIPWKIYIVDALKMELNGDIEMLGNNSEPVHGEYNPCTDGWLQLGNHAWATFVATNRFLIGQVVMFLFHSIAEEFVPKKKWAKGHNRCMI